MRNLRRAGYEGYIPYNRFHAGVSAPVEEPEEIIESEPPVITEESASWDSEDMNSFAINPFVSLVQDQQDNISNTALRNTLMESVSNTFEISEEESFSEESTEEEPAKNIDMTKMITEFIKINPNFKLLKEDINLREFKNPAFNLLNKEKTSLE